LTCIVSTSYLPPVSYFRTLARHGSYLLEAHEHFVKQTIRNRCEIAGANGTLTLTVPIAHADRWRTPIRELKISGTAWKQQHWRSIFSAYGKSAFFTYYADELEQILFRSHVFLWDLNLELTEKLSGWLQLPTKMAVTSEYVASYPDLVDFRNFRVDKRKEERPYYQIFSERHGFKGDLSAIDLLFNTGPEARSFI
jgi:hypothetical protein